MEQLINITESMKTDLVSNYVIAGLDSYTLKKGMVRLFTNSRNHQDQVTPHSHRFDFTCLVLTGSVTNRLWRECEEEEGDFFEHSILTYTGTIGEHSIKLKGRDFFGYTDKVYNEGECYSMNSDDIHSISFSKGAKVLFFEGPSQSDESVIIEPVVDGRVIRTYQSLDYMFLSNQ